MKNKDEILKKIKPTKLEQVTINFKVRRFVKKLNRNLKAAEAIVGGSVAKGTFLKGEHDVDIFVLFVNDTDISNKLAEALSIFKNVERLKGSRDYFQIGAYGLNFEVVPVFKIKNIKEAKNITDISPLHVVWVRKNTKGKLADEIRLIKAFCKAQGVYGAETHIKGFSGYVLEILTIYYKGFENLIKNSARWKNKEVIDISKHYKGLNKSKVSPLIVVDPIDSKRNAAAALSEEKLKKFKAACKGYLNNPKKDFFERRKIVLEDLEDKDAVLKAKPLEGRRDVIGAKLLKALNIIKRILQSEGYEITEADWFWDKDALFWFKVKTQELPPFKKHYGPPVNKKKNLAGFKNKWKGFEIKEENGRAYVNIPRDFVKMHDFLIYMIKDEEVLKCVKDIKIIK